MSRILVVDDEPFLRDTIVGLLRARKHDVEAVATGEEGLDIHARWKATVAILDLLLPGISGLELLKRLRGSDPALPCIMITAHGTVQSAVEAMKAGAFDYVLKPFDNNDLVLRVDRALELRRLTSRVSELEEDLSARSGFGNLVGRSEAIRMTLRRLDKVSRSSTNVLLLGETGTGKGLAAISLHRGSPRAERPFIPVNCGAISASLAETELFGHVRGAFTDARTDHRGKFDQANGGTLFLDEVSELSPDLQVKLLRVIEDRQVYPVGAERPTPVDARIIAATNRDLEQDVKQGRFREDLFWRLNVFRVVMPPLRDRLDDLSLLVDRQLDLINAECRTAITAVSPSVMERFRSHPWPGNVRELTNALRHAAVMAESETVQLADLPDYLVMAPPRPSAAAGQSLNQLMLETERHLLEATLERFKGNRTAAAEALGITRKTLYNKLRQPKPDSNA